MSNPFNEAKSLFDQHELAGSLDIVSHLIVTEPENREAFLLRARIYYKMQRWGDAMNDYGSVLELDPGNQEAKSGIEMARSILGYFTPDMFNP
ncbi:MAG TPA: tetratricopeptide repeat protein [Prolixibacteraceae bacterium]|jgi:cytochrome c-type biogenesis protein CcmH/NrfG